MRHFPSLLPGTDDPLIFPVATDPTQRHDAIREMEIALLLQHRSAPTVLQGLPAKINAMAMGNLPHAASALTALYQQITQIPAQN
jgi:hypothetical protein